MRLKTKLITSKLLLTIIPVLAVATVILSRTNLGFSRFAANARHSLETNTERAREGLIHLAKDDLTHIAENVYRMCAQTQELQQQKVDANLVAARDVLDRTGATSFAAERVTWNAVNQFTKDTTTVDLPRFMVGELWTGQNPDLAVPTPVVDEVMRLTGATCTIFQRMDEAGSMLRVATNVAKLDNTRAIGTYIPATQPDGSPNPVVSTLLEGKTFRGRAFVVNAWYVTAYEPITAADGSVVGALYVGVKEESSTALRNGIMSIKIGKTGYVYVLNAKGSTRGHYVISAGGKRDGEDIWNAKDADGRLFIQDICAIATGLAPGQTAETTYPWKNAADPKPRKKIVKLAYFAPWDWVIGAGSYEDEFYHVADEIEAKSDETIAAMQHTKESTIRSSVAWAAGVTLLVIIVATIVALSVARSIANPLTRIITGLGDGAAVVLGSAADGKATLIASLGSAAIASGLAAGVIIKEIAPLVGGGGGGKPQMARAGGKDPAGLPKALDRAREMIGGA